MGQEAEARTAWVEVVSEDEARGLLGERPSPYDFGFVPAMGRLLMSHQRIGPAFLAIYGTIMFAPESSLDRAEREMVAAVAAAAQDCFY